MTKEKCEHRTESCVRLLWNFSFKESECIFRMESMITIRVDLLSIKYAIYKSVEYEVEELSAL